MRKLALALLPVAAAVLPLVAPVSAQAATPAVMIAVIQYNSPGSDNGSNTSLNAEWVQLRNTTAHPITLTNWTLSDTAGHVYTFGTYRIKAHSTVKIHTGTGNDGQFNLYQDRGAYVWNNDGDTATLRGPAGGRRDRCTYSDPSELHASVAC